MFSKVRVMDAGDSEYLPGEITDIIKFKVINKELTDKKKRAGKGERLLLGLTRIALFTDSWLSAASFQETIRVLVEASTTNRVDRLEGLKENVIIGKLIPAGETYRKKYHFAELGNKSMGNAEVVPDADLYRKKLPVL
jgi:DNA-directed RNA polymerase subunit beta'